jgi:hypothetical protein
VLADLHTDLADAAEAPYRAGVVPRKHSRPGQRAAELINADVDRVERAAAQLAVWTNRMALHLRLVAPPKDDPLRHVRRSLGHHGQFEAKLVEHLQPPRRDAAPVPSQ